MDTEGVCVIVATPFEDQDDAAKILTDPVKPIKSQFSPSFSLAVNLIARGEGKLDVARQLVGKSFAMWEKRQIEESINDAVKQGKDVSEVLQASAQERFMNVLIDTLQLQVERRRSKFDIARIESLLELLTDRESLKKTSKTYLGAAKMLELERTTLGYLEKELETMRSAMTVSEEDRLLEDLLVEDERELIDQINTQRKRAVSSEKEVNKHPFSAIVEISNAIMNEGSPEATILLEALRGARKGDEESQDPNSPLTASELSIFSKSAIIVRRKAQKLTTSGDGSIDPVSLLEQEAKNAASSALSDSWDDMKAIVKTLVAYGCLSTDGSFTGDDESLGGTHLHCYPSGYEFRHVGLRQLTLGSCRSWRSLGYHVGVRPTRPVSLSNGGFRRRRPRLVQQWRRKLRRNTEATKGSRNARIAAEVFVVK